MISRFIIVITWPFLIVLFILLNCLTLVFTPVTTSSLSNYKLFVNEIFLYTSLTITFTLKLVYVFLNNKYVQQFLFPCAIILIDISYLLLKCGDIETEPGPQLRNNNLNICYWNIGGLPTDNYIKKINLEAFLSNRKFDIVMIGETHLKNDINNNDLQIEGYTLIRCDHPSNAALGGVCVYYKSNLPIILKPELTLLNECIIMELKVGNKKCFITCLYRSPANNTKEKIDEFVTNLEQTINNIDMKNPYASFILGDFNAKNTNWWGNINDYQGTQIDQITSMCGYNQIINDATNLEPHCEPSCIDLMFCSQPNLIQNSGTYASLFERCHHQIIFAEINFKVFYPPPYKKKIWDYKNADVNKINESISQIDWVRHLSQKDPNEQTRFLNDTIINVFNNYCPNKVITCRDKDAPWMNDAIKKLLKEKESIYKSYVKNGFKNEDKSKLNAKQKECSSVISKEKELYMVNEGNKLNDPCLGPKRYCTILNRFLNKKKIPLIPPILHDETFITDTLEKADLFNNYFASQCTPFINDSILPAFSYRTNSRISEINISSNMILDIVSSMNPSKSHGCDGISIKMIHICRNQIILPLKLIFESCARLGVYPDLWKRSNVCPVHKKESKNLCSNYRPISLLPIFSKIFEKIIYDSLYRYIITNKLLNPCQSGFQKGDSCVSQLLKITHDIFKNLDSNPPVITRSIFLDMSKAFDKVWHEGLLFKLKSYGVEGTLFNMLHNYLSNRKQRVTINGQESDWKNISSGVPQGSVLGPLLFLLYVNDLADNLQCNPKLFADDVSLNEHMNNIPASTTRLNLDLDSIDQWGYQWKMLFNPDPTKPANEVIFSNRSTTNIPCLSFAGKTIQSVKSHKHLGLIFDSKLDFNQHLKEKITKANIGIQLLRKLYRYLPRNTLLNIYKSFIRPHLDYCDIIYHKPCSEDIAMQNLPCVNAQHPNVLFTDKIESVQYNAALAITGCIRGTSKEKIYNELGIESLYNRRTFHRLFYLYKIKNNLLPAYLKNELPRPAPNPYHTRHHRSTWISTRTNKYNHSFFPHSVNAWGNLSNLIKASPSPNIFKKRYMDFYRIKPNSIFRIHNPVGIKLLTRLRVGLSHLRQHKFNHHFNDTDSPYCPCDGRSIESVDHYLLSCPNHARSRTLLFEDISSINGLTFVREIFTSEILMYGKSSYDDSTNKKIIESTINFLTNSYRFSDSLFTG